MRTRGTSSIESALHSLKVPDLVLRGWSGISSHGARETSLVTDTARPGGLPVTALSHESVPEFSADSGGRMRARLHCFRLPWHAGTHYSNVSDAILTWSAAVVADKVLLWKLSNYFLLVQQKIL